MSQQQQRSAHGPLAVAAIIALAAGVAATALDDDNPKTLSLSAHWIASHIRDYDQPGVLTTTYTYHGVEHSITNGTTTLGKSTMRGFEGESQRDWLYVVLEPYDGSGVVFSITTTHNRAPITGVISVDGQPKATNHGRGGTRVVLP